uniref:Photosystem I assembly protein Ycf4 n=2 Tax=Psilotum nudum TaxID=3240 RepID=YCF4_PSINU|nr:photosystem I assembly protein Ycf4 [Psilotum nudum]Q8WI09.1 RecName: Full=Photosystem I assembly protein Ycf4 [Psilotum nudum]AGC26804.1 photosystem I assembly protein Ycf4 [Psilotum nudum]BAB84227.1 ycf4 protein [Psilotum nudum]
MKRQSEWIRVESIRGARRISNFFWAFILILGALGFLLVGSSSYLGRDLIPLLPSQQIVFIPQGIVMCFYGIAGISIGFYLGFAISWDIGNGYNLFDKQRGIVRIFRWGFPGENRRICIQFFMKDIQAIGLEIREGFYSRRIIYMRMKGQQKIFLTHISENSTLKEMEEKAANLARFMCVSIEGI